MDNSPRNTRSAPNLKRSYESFNQTENDAPQQAGPDEIPVVLEKLLANKLSASGKLMIDGSIGDGELLELSAWIAQSPSQVKDIEIDLCVDSDYLAGLLIALGENNKVTTLNLTGGHISKEVCAACAQMLHMNASIDVLRIAGNWADSDSICLVFQGVENNKTLKTLSIENPEFGKYGMEALAGTLKSNRSIKTLCLMEIPINTVAAESLANAFRDNNVLSKVVIVRSGISTAGMKKLLEGILESQSLTRITIPERAFEEEDEARLVEVFRRNQQRNEQSE
ncbi:leucine-rich repeat domain-containing protein [Noviherbaspirillum pedocola]|uniref:Uncharacterized protein n=1 Tax=Noviherbaspirillum pedocola TaxID=2801341 RepID=A0A934STH6_9BURK|nr:hypothetical protein [Noviherbaspirillum pedocola]MBK4734916.1 hypothetical protein [Noviherbaspirillum pedocola]